MPGGPPPCRSGHPCCEEMSRMKWDWLPTADNINRLPDPLRQYIHDIETNADPAGMVAENTILKDQVQQLLAKIEGGRVH